MRLIARAAGTEEMLANSCRAQGGQFAHSMPYMSLVVAASAFGLLGVLLRCSGKAPGADFFLLGLQWGRARWGARHTPFGCMQRVSP